MNFPSLTQGPDVVPFQGGRLDDPTIRTVYEQGARRSRNRQTVVPRIWKLLWSHLTATDLSTLLTFESDSVGYGGTAFSWDNPDDGVQYDVTFGEPLVWNINPIDPRHPEKRYRVSGLLEERV